MTAPTVTPAAADSREDSRTVTFVLDGIPFMGKLLKMYPVRGGHLMMAVQVEGYAINGRWFAAENDDSAIQVSAEALV